VREVQVEHDRRILDASRHRGAVGSRVSRSSQSTQSTPIASR
jgi:hypothetical protein